MKFVKDIHGWKILREEEELKYIIEKIVKKFEIDVTEKIVDIHQNKIIFIGENGEKTDFRVINYKRLF